MHLQGLALICFGVGIGWALLRLFTRTPLRRVAVEGVFAGYLVAVAFVVFFTAGGVGRSGAPFSWQMVNLVPLRTILEFALGENPAQAVRQLVGNVILFVPLGVLLPTMSPRFQSVTSLFPAAVIASITIEISQLVLGLLGLASRSTDIDDVILNTIGALVGWAVWRPLDAFWAKTRYVAPTEGRGDE